MTDLDCRAVATAAQHNVYCHKLEHRHEHKEVATQEERIDVSYIGDSRKVRLDRERKRNNRQDRGNRNQDLIAKVLQIHPIDRPRHRDHHQQRKEDFPDVEAVSALHVYCHPDLGSSLGGAADEFIGRFFSQAANFPLGHANVARAIELQHTSLLYQRDEITIRKTWLQIENQLLTVEREAEQVVVGRQVYDESLHVDDVAGGIRADSHLESIAWLGRVRHRQPGSPHLVFAVVPAPNAEVEERGELQTIVLPNRGQVAIEFKCFLHFVDGG